MVRRQPAQPHEAATEAGPEEVREASMRLPERQHEVLELRGEQRSYEQIAAIMETSPDSVAQLISRARINLYDELRGTVLASVAPPSPDCERALPLIAARDDEQLDAGSGDAAWLDDHLAGCDRCRLGEEQMREADASYRTLAPIAGAAVESPVNALPAPAQSSPGAPPAPLSVTSRTGLPRSRAVLASALAVLLLLGGLAAAFVKDDGAPAPAAPAAHVASGGDAAKSAGGAKPAGADGNKGAAVKAGAKRLTTAAKTNGSGAAGADVTPMPVTPSSQATTGADAPSGSPSHPTRPSGTAAVEPTKQTSAPKSPSKPKPAPTAAPASQPASAPAPAPEAPTTTEEPSDAPGRSGEAPGKPPGRPGH